MSQALSDRLRTAREAVRPKLSQRRLAKMIVIENGEELTPTAIERARRNVIRWEKGENAPNDENVAVLAKLLNLSPAEVNGAKQTSEPNVDRRLRKLEARVRALEDKVG